MPGPRDLEELGNLLRQRREELGLGRSELARRAAVSPTYVALIEDARPRREGRASSSRPTRDLLLRWTRALGLDAGRTREMLVLAGHLLPGTDDDVIHRTERMGRTDRKPTVQDTGSPYTAVGLNPRAEAVVRRVQEVLALAAESERQDEVVDALAFFLELLAFRLEHRARE